MLNAFYDAGTAAEIGRLSTHTMRHAYRSWLDAVGAPITVQQKLMRHASVITTLDVCGDVVTDEMSEVGSKVVGLAQSQSDCKLIASVSRWLKTWRRGWDLNPPANANSTTCRARMARFLHGKHYKAVLTDCVTDRET